MEVKVFVTPTVPGRGYFGESAPAASRYPVASTSASAAAMGTRGSTAAGAVRSDVPGRNDFLHLLTTQLKYQDPLKPVQDHEFIAQLAQFSTLEELQGLNRRMDELAQLQLWVSGMGQASSLIGRRVVLELPDGTSVTGTVSAVRMKDGVPYLQVGDREYIVTSVVQIQ